MSGARLEQFLLSFSCRQDLDRLWNWWIQRWVLFLYLLLSSLGFTLFSLLIPLYQMSSDSSETYHFWSMKNQEYLEQEISSNSNYSPISWYYFSGSHMSSSEFLYSMLIWPLNIRFDWFSWRGNRFHNLNYEWNLMDFSARAKL